MESVQPVEIAVVSTPRRRIWGRSIRVRRMAVAAIWISVVVAWRSYQTSNELGTDDAAQRFIDAVDTAWWGVAAYVAMYLARPLVLFPASVLTVVGGILFGPILGVAVVIVAANASALIAYGAARGLGRHRTNGLAVADEESVSIIARWSDRLRVNGFETVLVMRLLFLPYDLVNYACGLLRLPWRPFLFATALGSLPGTVSFVLLGASLDRVDRGLDGLDPVALVAGVAIFVVSLIGARLLRNRQGMDIT